jgi:ABC-type multidrug transport system fused ATPase/permease subunit
MNKDKQLMNLTWKYFWKQKIQEFGTFFGVIFLTIITLYLFSYLGRFFDELIIQYFDGELIFVLMNTFWKHMAYGLLALCFLLEIGVLLYLLIFICCNICYYVIYYPIKYFIESNWNKAKEKARLELKNKKR